MRDQLMQVEEVDQTKIENCCQYLEVLKALSSPAFLLSESQEDPVLEAFAITYLAELRQQYDSAFRVSAHLTSS